MKQQFMVERGENRVDMKLTAMLIGTHGKLGVEKAITENVSTRGVRVISTSEWFIDDTILVSLPAGHLEFVGSSETLEINALGAALESPQV
jgi:hypothetical protein